MPISDAFTLDELELNAWDVVGPHLELVELKFTPAKKRVQFVSGADSDGARPTNSPAYDNSAFDGRIQAVACPDLATALALFGRLAGRLERAERVSGIALDWTPDATPLHGTALSGEVTEIPITFEDGWFAHAPTATFHIDCDPFFLDDEAIGPSASGAGPLLTLEVPDVPGDVAALGRLVVTDTAGQVRRTVEWGRESTYHDPDDPAPLLIDSDDLVTAGYAGSPGTWGSVSVIDVTLGATPSAMCAIPAQPHVGSFRVRARVRSTRTDARVRLVYQQGDGLLQANPYASMPVSLSSVLCEVDLGTITITPAELGTQAWSGFIEIYQPDADGTGNFKLDYLVLIPTEGYGRARGTATRQPAAITIRESFATTTGALDAETTDTGETWATSGDATDFAAGDGGVTRAVNTDTAVFGPEGRRAHLDTTLTATEVSADVKVDGLGNGSTQLIGVLGRYVDDGNYIAAAMVVSAGLSTPNVSLWLSSQAPGGPFAGADFLALPINVFYKVRLIAYPSGRAIAQLCDVTGTIVHAQLEVTDALLAAGGTLESGAPGMIDYNAAAPAGGGPQPSHTFRNFAAGLPAPESVVIHAGRAVEFRHGGPLRQDSAGTTYSRPLYRGGPMLLPPGDSRVVVKAHRNDVDVSDDEAIDAFAIQQRYTPRYLLPR